VKIFKTSIITLICFTFIWGGSASSITVTSRYQNAIEITHQEEGDSSAHALWKLLKMIQGDTYTPLVKSFVDAALGQDTVSFIDRTIINLKRHRDITWTDMVIATLSAAKNQLIKTDHLNANKKPEKIVKLLSYYRFNVHRYKKHVQILSGEKPVIIKSPKTNKAQLVHLNDRHIMNKNNKIPETLQFLTEYYNELGFKAELLPFTLRGKKHYNLEVTIPGQSTEEVILGAHYDTATDHWSRSSSSNGDKKVAPGADDNASGVAALMEAAQAFKGMKLEKTIKLVHFGAEEMPGNVAGSRKYIEQRSEKSLEKIKSVFIFDAIGFNNKKESKVYLHTTNDMKSLELGSHVTQANQQYRTKLNIVGNIPEDGHTFTVEDTDSYHFSRKGIPTIFLSEDLRWRKGLHDRFDTSDMMDMKFAGKIVRTGLEAVARVAKPIKSRTKTRKLKNMKSRTKPVERRQSNRRVKSLRAAAVH